MTKVVVTGGAGYVGSHVVWALKEAGFHAQIIDTYTNGGHLSNVAGFPVLSLGYETLAAEYVLKQADAVIHCAASTSAPESMQDPGAYYRNNIGLMVFLLDRLKVKKTPVVFSSSAAVYGRAPASGLVTEDHLLDPPNPYGATKMIGEMMLRQWGLPHIALRYFNVAGADSSMRCGPRGDRGSLFSNILKASRQGRPVTLHMAEGDTPDGFPVRDFIHPSDLAQAHVSAVKALLEGRHYNCAMNVGTGQGHSVRQVFQQFRTCDPKLGSLIDAPRQGDPSFVVADASRITNLLGWKPTSLSLLPHMVGSAWRWDQKLREERERPKVDRLPEMGN